MSMLEKLIGIPLDKVSDEELEELVMKGRLAREQAAPAKATRKASPKKAEPEIDFDEFE